MDNPPSLKALYWVGSSKRDLLSLPGRGKACFEYALYLAKNGRKHEGAKPLKGFGSAGVLEVVEDWDRSTYRAVYTVRFEGVVFVLHIFQKKSKRGGGHAQGRYRSDPRASQSSGAVRQGAIAMKKQRVVRGIPVEEGSGNVYTDLGYPDSENMLVKAQLAAKIAEIIQRRALTQARAAEILGLTQPNVSDLLKGRFRGISEHRLLECLTRLGRDVHIVIKPTPRSRSNGRLTLSVA